MQCVLVCFSILQFCCSVLQCVAVFCIVRQYFAVCCVAVCCSVLCCSVLQFGRVTGFFVGVFKSPDSSCVAVVLQLCCSYVAVCSNLVAVDFWSVYAGLRIAVCCSCVAVCFSFVAVCCSLVAMDILGVYSSPRIAVCRRHRHKHKHRHKHRHRDTH